jgi:uncharacterized protein
MRRAIPIRHPRLGLSDATPRYWYGGDPGATHFLNALSTVFPPGEAFFVRSVQHYRALATDPAEQAAIRGFCGQEGVHSRVHERHVEILGRQGYPALANVFNRGADRELRRWNRHAPRFALATTAALEHLTAIMARRALSDPSWSAPMHADMAPLWQWHAMEEAEHKAVAFDLLRKVSKSHALRVAAMLFATFGLLADNYLRLVYLLAKDRLLLDARVWWRHLRFVWGRDGFYRGLARDYRRWYRRDFHPWQRDDGPLIDAQRARLTDAGVAPPSALSAVPPA